MVTGFKVLNMEGERNYSQINVNIQVNIVEVCRMGTEFTYGPTKKYIKENGLMVLNTAQDNGGAPMEILILENGT